MLRLLFGRTEKESKEEESRGIYKSVMHDYMQERGTEEDPGQQLQELMLAKEAEEQRLAALKQQKKVETKFLTSDKAFKSSSTRE